MEDVGTIKYTIQAAEEISNAGNPFGAWERVLTLTDEFPDDPEVNKLAMRLTTRVGEFVSTLEKAKQLEQNNQVGSSLAWYFKARRSYPAELRRGDGDPTACSTRCCRRTSGTLTSATPHRQLQANPRSSRMPGWICRRGRAAGGAGGLSPWASG